MKRGGKILLCVLSGLAAVTTTQAITDGSNPYGSIVERNVFNLKAPTPPPDPESLKPPPPKITLQGINSILGLRQVLFKVAPSKPGEKEQAYVLSEGQRQDEVEVLAIDEKEGSIKFNNHGTIETKTLKDDASKVPTTAVMMPGPIPRPMPTAGMTSPGGAPGAVGFPGGSSAMSSGRQIPVPLRQPRVQPAGSAAMAGTTTATSFTQKTAQPAQPAQPALTREEQTILMEIERERTKPLVEAGELPPLPPTELTPPGSKGMPAEAPPSLPGK
jgi:hypothetical protein